jgi:hypothetical protein
MKALHRYLPARSFALQVKRHRSNAWLPLHVSSWAAERTNFPREVAEAALAHVVGDRTEAAYRGGDLFEKRRRLMDAWAAHCAVTESKVAAGRSFRR